MHGHAVLLGLLKCILRLLSPVDLELGDCVRELLHQQLTLIDAAVLPELLAEELTTGSMRAQRNQGYVLGDLLQLEAGSEKARVAQCAVNVAALQTRVDFSRRHANRYGVHELGPLNLCRATGTHPLRL